MIIRWWNVLKNTKHLHAKGYALYGFHFGAIVYAVVFAVGLTAFGLTRFRESEVLILQGYCCLVTNGVISIYTHIAIGRALISSHQEGSHLLYVLAATPVIFLTPWMLMVWIMSLMFMNPLTVPKEIILTICFFILAILPEGIGEGE
jgi:hypothetical protein